MTVAIAHAPPKTRLAFIDNLRWVMIVLVISMHAAVTYSHLGGWYYMEDPRPGRAAMAAFATYQIFLQAFFMGLLFLIAGYFVPDALDRKGLGRFARDRALRLGVPALLFMLFVQPLVVYWLLRDFYDRSRPSLVRAYLPYLARGDFLSGSGPMWFTLALLLFSVAYGMIWPFSPAARRRDSGAALPRNIEIVALALSIGACTFLVRIVQPVGKSVLNMQLCYFSQYVILFAIGIRARRRNWLLRFPYAQGMRWLAVALIGGLLGWLLIVVAVTLTHSESRIVGGFTWQSAALSFWESFVGVGMCVGLIVLFREKLNQQGRFAMALSDNSFAVYMFHTPLLIAVTLSLSGFAAPKPVKFLIAALLGTAITYLASIALFRRIPLLNRIL